MSFIDFNEFRYVPILCVRPAEMSALEGLPEAKKDNLLPYILLQPWVAAMEFESVIKRIGDAYGKRPIIVDLANTASPKKIRPVHARFSELRNSRGGFAAWYDFLEENVNFIPSIQLADPKEIPSQVAHLRGLNRGVVVRINENILGFAEDIANLLKGYSKGQVYFIIDFERQNRELLTKVAMAIAVAGKIRKIIPDCFFSVSASTFPETFVGIEDQDIYERRFHDLIIKEIGPDNMIYCDRASVRAERQGGGGGAPAPRIDNASVGKWHFFREPDEADRGYAYRKAAERAVTSPAWRDLKIWGTDLIKNTAVGLSESITSAQLSTAARINIHIYTQLTAKE